MFNHWLERSRNLSGIDMRKQVAQKKRRRKDRRSRIEQLEKRELLARDVAGIISEDETWSGTIHVTSNVTIAAE